MNLLMFHRSAYPAAQAAWISGKSIFVIIGIQVLKLKIFNHEVHEVTRRSTKGILKSGFFG